MRCQVTLSVVTRVEGGGGDTRGPGTGDGDNMWVNKHLHKQSVRYLRL